MYWGWKDGPAVKSPYCSSRGPKFNSKLTRWLTTTCNCSSTLLASLTSQTYTQSKHIEENENKKETTNHCVGMGKVWKTYTNKT